MDIPNINSAIPTFGSPTLEGLEVGPNVSDGQRIGGSSKRQFVHFYKKKIAEPYAVEVKVNERTGNVQVVKTDVRTVEKEFVRVVTPGDKNDVDDFAQDYHRREYWNHYRNFRDGKGIPLGTPIEDCHYVAPSIQTELKYLGVHTEEQLADAADILVERLPDGHSLRVFARTNCQARLDNAGSGQIALLQKQLADMAQKVEELSAVQQPSIITPQDGLTFEKKTRAPRANKKIDLEA
jgi:hypothetical protein